MQRKFFTVAFFALFYTLFSESARAALIEHNLVVEPDFVHCDDCHRVSGVYGIRSTMRVPLPELTLAPGDFLQVTLEFANGKILKPVPFTQNGYQDIRINLAISEDGHQVGELVTGVGGTLLTQAFDANSQLVFQEQWQPSFHFVTSSQERVRYTSLRIVENFYPDEPPAPTVRNLLFEYQVPTSFDSFAGDFDYQTTTFPVNWIDITYDVFEQDGPPASNIAVFVVPEPGTLSLLSVVAILAVCFRRS
jgi:hypothetical protein